MTFWGTCDTIQVDPIMGGTGSPLPGVQHLNYGEAHSTNPPDLSHVGYCHSHGGTEVGVYSCNFKSCPRSTTPTITPLTGGDHLYYRFLPPIGVKPYSLAYGSVDGDLDDAAHNMIVMSVTKEHTLSHHT